MKRIGIMGGTFNPIHNGHLAIAGKAREQFSLEQVLFMPNGVPYRKDLAQVLPVRIRCEMTALAIAKEPYFTLSDMEVSDASQGKNTYTYETLQKLKNADPDADYYFILGADSLSDMEHWKHPERIFQSCTILAAVRDDASHTGSFHNSRNMSKKDNLNNKCNMREILQNQKKHLQKKFDASIEILEIAGIDVSSTQIRELANAGKSIHGLVPEAVEAYIEKNALYR